MDSRLQHDLNRFFSVYQNNISSTLHQKLPSPVANSLEDELTEELSLLRRSVLKRLAEEFNR